VGEGGYGQGLFFLSGIPTDTIRGRACAKFPPIAAPRIFVAARRRVTPTPHNPPPSCNSIFGALFGLPLLFALCGILLRPIFLFHFILS